MVQKGSMGSQCKKGMVVGKTEPPLAPPDALRVNITCTEPKVVATLVAASAYGKVLSYEHYRYDVTAMTPELERADVAILSTLQIKPPASPSKP